jgi:hypothetical protein
LKTSEGQQPSQSASHSAGMVKETITMYIIIGIAIKMEIIIKIEINIATEMQIMISTI